MCQTYASLSTLVRKMPLCSLMYKLKYSGLPRNLWKLPQTFGRAGRDKSLQAVAVQVFWPGQKGIYLENLYGASAACKYNFVLAGKSTPAGKVREIFLKQTCPREALNAAFTLSNVHSEDFFYLDIAWTIFIIFTLRVLRRTRRWAESVLGAILCCRQSLPLQRMHVLLRVHRGVQMRGCYPRL